LRGNAFSLNIGPTKASEPEIYIRLNQLGFRPHAYKSAVIFSREPLPAEFRIVNTIGTFFFAGNIKPVCCFSI